MMHRLVLFVLLLAGISFNTAAFSEDVLIEAEKLFAQNRLDRAQNLVEEFLDDNAAHPQATLLKITILLKRNKISQALTMLEENSRSLRTLPEYYNNLAYAYFLKGKDNDAIEALQNGIAIDERFNTLYKNLSTIYAFKAKAAYEKAIEETSNIQKDLPKLTLVSRLERTSTTGKTATTVTSPAINLQETEANVKSAIKQWAKAWSDQDARGYLDAYSEEFITPAGVSMANWRNYRRERLSAPSYIKVRTYNFDVRLSQDGSLASAHFVQHYRSNTLNDKVIKHLVLINNRSQWKILSENIAN